MRRSARKIFTVPLTAVYLALAIASPFAVFHQHRLPLQDMLEIPEQELHDALCDVHVNAHLHLSYHCAACQFTSLKQSDSAGCFHLADQWLSQIYSGFNIPFSLSQPHLSAASGRAPPSFLS